MSKDTQQVRLNGNRSVPPKRKRNFCCEWVIGHLPIWHKKARPLRFWWFKGRVARHPTGIAEPRSMVVL